MNTTTHLEQTLQRDIDLIRQKVLEMSGLAGHALELCLQALRDRDRQRALIVILRDPRIDELEKEIDRLCLEFLVRQQPVARHLRFAYAAIKINAELERIGDYAESIARQILKIEAISPLPASGRFIEIANLSIPMVRDAVRGFVEQDAALARQTMATEDRVNDLRDQLNAELLAAEREGRIPLDEFTPLMTIARRFERVSDQAKNICEETLYVCTGEYSKHKRTDTWQILLVDRRHSCLGPMAEAIGRSLGQPQLVFSSTGLEPQPVDPRVVSFLAGKQIDVCAQTPKALADIPDFSEFQVVIALEAEARKTFPLPPTKTVTLDWSTKDPSQSPGTLDEARPEFEAAFRFLQSHLTDLVEAILGNQPA